MSLSFTVSLHSDYKLEVWAVSFSSLLPEVKSLSLSLSLSFLSLSCDRLFGFDQSFFLSYVYLIWSSKCSVVFFGFFLSPVSYGMWSVMWFQSEFLFEVLIYCYIFQTHVVSFWDYFWSEFGFTVIFSRCMWYSFEITFYQSLNLLL